MNRAGEAVARMTRARWLNAVLGVVLVAVIAAAWFSVRSTPASTTVADRTATVTRGSVTATVTGSGNLTSSRTSSLAFGASGKVTAVEVKVGDRVKKGDTLARIDTASARRTLAAAKAALESARASYDELVAGQSALDAESDRLQIESARLTVTSATTSLSTAKKKLATDITAKAPAGTLSQDRSGVTQARQQLASARVQLAQQRATAAKNAAGASPADVAQDKVTIENAEVDVDDAQDALAATKLTAPFAGTILSVAGEEGDTVSAGTSSSASSSSGTGSSSGASGSTSSTGASGSGGSSGTSGTSSSSSSTSGASSSTFITMAGLDRLDVTANVAEADIGPVKNDQDAEITLSATGQTMAGTVTAVSPEGTTSSNVVQYPVTVTVADPPSTARLGASVSVTITTGSADDVLLLPTAAISTSGTRHTVNVLRGGVVTPTVIGVGLAGSSTTEVASGLADGDVVRIPTTGTGSSASFGVPGFGAGGAARGLGGGGR